MMTMIQLLCTHGEVVVTLLVAIIALVRLTGWGRANAEALQVVVNAIEQLEGTAVKQEVARRQSGLSEVAQDVLADAVNTADLKKTPLTTALRVCREVLRGLFPVRG